MSFLYIYHYHCLLMGLKMMILRLLLKLQWLLYLLLLYLLLLWERSSMLQFLSDCYAQSLVSAERREKVKVEVYKVDNKIHTIIIYTRITSGRRAVLFFNEYKMCFDQLPSWASLHLLFIFPPQKNLPENANIFCTFLIVVLIFYTCKLIVVLF